MTHAKHSPRGQDAGRVRQAKGSVQEAIGKIIGDPGLEREGRRESDAGARQADPLADPAPVPGPPVPGPDTGGRRPDKADRPDG